MSDSDGDPVEAEIDDGESSGRDAARRLLARARRSPAARRRGRARPEVVADQAWSGAGPDARDPARIEATVAELVTRRRWARSLDQASLAPRWEQIVGADVAAHCRPERLDAGELTIVAESTAWATQLRLMSRQLVAAITATAGPDLVRTIRVNGPTSPDWRHGPLRVSGRGPRDTYG